MMSVTADMGGAHLYAVVRTHCVQRSSADEVTMFGVCIGPASLIPESKVGSSTS